MARKVPLRWQSSRGPMRRFLSFLMATAILLAGLALATAEVVRAEGIGPGLF